MAMLRNHYELLGVQLNASNDEIRAAYIKKITTETDTLMSEYIKTAYYVLKNPIRRQKYDLSLGIHKYRKVPGSYRVGKGIARGILTVLDFLFTFYWCVLLAIILIVTGIYIYKYKTTGTIDFSVVSFFIKYKDEVIILGGLALIDLLGHYYIRRANRLLKNYKWEYFIKEEKEHDK